MSVVGLPANLGVIADAADLTGDPDHRATVLARLDTEFAALR